MSIPLALAHLDSGLDDAQVQSLVHQLRHEYATMNGAPVLGQAEWDQYRNGLRERVTFHPTLRPQRRTGMIARIDNAGDAPAPDMIFAAEQIRERSRLSARLLRTHLAREAARIGLPDDQAQEVYERGRAATSGGRRECASAEERSRWAMLPLDPRTRDGLAALQEQPDVPEIPLITEHAPVTWTPAGTFDVSRVGYHPDSQRLEVITSDGQLLAYRGVTAGTVAELRSRADSNYFASTVRGVSQHQYATAREADAAGVRRRCGHCGQFCGAVHRCPGSQGGHRGPLLQASAQYLGEPLGREQLRGEGTPGLDELDTVAFADVAAHLHQHPDQVVEFPAAVSTADLTIAGALRAGFDPDTARVSIDTAFLGCRCAQFTAPDGCDHTREIAERVRGSLEVAAREWTQRQAAAAAAAIAARTTIQEPVSSDRAVTFDSRTTLVGTVPGDGVEVAAPASASASTRPAVESLLPEAPNQSTFSYSEDPQRFAHDVRQVLDRVEEVGPEQAIDWMDGTDRPVLYGFGAQRRFGVELEYDARDFNEIAHIPRHLYNAGLTPSSRRGGYHAAARTGYNETLDRGWSLESDATVTGGELVSPILHDTPQAWAQLAQACSIIRTNGGAATPAAGGHVTVSAPEQAGQAARLTRFLRVVELFQDDLYVMANAGQGRNDEWRQPIRPVPPQGYVQMAAMTGQNRYQAVNLQHVANSSQSYNASQSRIEFRLWDASLEAPRTQAQIRMSTALLDYATHDRSAVDAFTQQDATRAVNPADVDALAASTSNLRVLFDRLFRRDEDKHQALALWATGMHHANHWQRT